jgi:predicted lipoprotein with Yx(FWY)xxD motif
MRKILVLSAVAVAALALAACGSSSSDSSSSTSAGSTPKPAPATSSNATVVGLRTTPLGKVLVDGSGRTLYLFEKDKGPKSNCSGACASAWPPVTTTGAPMAGAGVTASKLTLVKGPGGGQVLYAGHPLYTYAGDSSAGQTNGEALDQFGAEWYVLNSQGAKVEKAGS